MDPETSVAEPPDYHLALLTAINYNNYAISRLIIEAAFNTGPPAACQ